MCRLASGPLQNGRVWVSEHGARGRAMSFTLVEAGANYGWPVAHPIAAVSRSAISAAQSAPGLDGSRAGLDPAIAPPVWRSDRGRSVSRLEWQSVRVGWSRAMCAGSALQAAWRVAV